MLRTKPVELNEKRQRGFWDRVDRRGPDDCWPWKKFVAPEVGAGKGGYGIYLRYLAHRVAYTLGKGPIPPGRLVTHTCDCRICCNPAHLVVVGERWDEEEKELVAALAEEGK